MSAIGQHLPGWHIHAHAVIGARSAQEDAHGVTTTPDGSVLLIVCDGMGGHAGGADASQHVVRSMLAEAAAGTVRPLRAALLRAVPSWGNTTVVVALLSEDGTAELASAGDSSILVDGELANPIHNLAAELTAQGTEVMPGARAHSIVTEWLGPNRPRPDIWTGRVHVGDSLRLHTDGLDGHDLTGLSALEEVALLDGLDGHRQDNATLVSARRLASSSTHGPSTPPASPAPAGMPARVIP